MALLAITLSDPLGEPTSHPHNLSLRGARGSALERGSVSAGKESKRLVELP